MMQSSQLQHGVGCVDMNDQLLAAKLANSLLAYPRWMCILSLSVGNLYNSRSHSTDKVASGTACTNLVVAFMIMGV